MNPGYSVVIATLDRPGPLRRALESLAAQTLLPARVVVVDASATNATLDVVGSLKARLPLEHRFSKCVSAARQRNLGAQGTATELIAFMDDDVVLPPGLFEDLARPFGEDAGKTIGGVAGRIEDMEHPKPSGFLWWYYRIQAGYYHPDYGGLLFGPAINTLPCYAGEQARLVRSDWLNSTCVLYRTEVFQRHFFPEFEGYSFLEDVHLSSRIARTHRLYFHRDAVYQHLSEPSNFKRDLRAMGRMAMAHRKVVARDVMGLSPGDWLVKSTLQRLFLTAVLLRQSGLRAWSEIAGTWNI